MVTESLLETWHENANLTKDVQLSFKARLLHQEKTAYQDLRIYDHALLGKVLVLDGILQTTEHDEFVYHEMMSHIPLLGRQKAGQDASVLIIGGGDGGTLREVLKHPWVKRAVMVELDEAVVRTTQKYFGFNGNYDDPRVKLIIGDGKDYMKSDEARQNPFDVVIIDSTDPIGPGEVLYTEEFCIDIREGLTPTGVMCRHLGVAAFQPQVLSLGYQRMMKVFSNAQIFRAAVPTYIGGDMAFILSSKDGHACQRPHLEWKGKYYNPAIHSAAFALPTWWQEHVRPYA